MKNIKLKLLEIPAFYINLPHQPERKEKVEDQLLYWGHKNFNRLDGIYPSNKDEWPWRGQSNAYTNACSQQSAPFIVFEDDILLNNPITEIEVPTDADAIYLGGCCSLIDGPIYEAEETDNPNLVKIKKVLSNHAILYLSNDLVSEYKEALKEDKRADLVMVALSEKYNFYAVQPVIFYQNDPRPGYEGQNLFTRVSSYTIREMFNAPENSL
jgi:hypothetical protein